MNVTSPRRVGHRVVRRDARPRFSLQPNIQPSVQLPLPVPARPPTLWQRLHLWLWPRLTPEQVYARFLRERRADLFPRAVLSGGHPVLLTAPEPTRSRTHRAQSDLP